MYFAGIFCICRRFHHRGDKEKIMGLDIYFYKAKDKESWFKYVCATRAYDKFTSSLWDKYEKETEEAYNKWVGWQEELFAKRDADKITEAEFNLEYEKQPYAYALTDFMTTEELAEYTKLEQGMNIAKDECGKTEIDTLYMRKQYWFIQYCYNKFKDFMVKEKRYDGKVLADEHFYDMILSKHDIKSIIDKLEFLSQTPKDRLTSSVVKYFSLDSHRDEIKEVKYIDNDYFELVFPRYTEYVHSYRDDQEYSIDMVKRYLDEFKNVYDNMAEAEIIWVDESW